MTVESTDIKLIFFEALEKGNAPDRAAYLDQTCGPDTALRQQVEMLLQEHEQVEPDFLESPPIKDHIAWEESALTEGTGTVIGPYKLLEKIGEGGMAVVYMAQQCKPLKRRVALKIIKLGMDTKEVIARFEAERQALALMDHPNIARVFDAGATDTGRPYFAMELVRGVTITEYCDQNKLTTQQRLELFMAVCHAVHHAHQRGIIHRDLKPSNIMVTLRDGNPIPKVIDFGIAKATNRELTERTIFTRYAQMIGTPEYMSPEQAEMSDLDIDTRTDIYSLGVVLYELLTGTQPFDPGILRTAAYREIQRIICEEEPPRPSTRISSLGQKAHIIAERRGTNVAVLTKRLVQELEWIPIMAMRKDRTRRYTSASEFGQDIRNYLNDRPLLAGPESTLYRVRKTVHKYRIPVMAVSAVTMALIMGFIVSTSLYVRMRQAINTVSQLESKAQIDSQLSTVQRLYAEGQYQAALQEFDGMLKSKDLGHKAHLLRAQLSLELGEFKSAEDELLRLTQAEPEIAGAAHALLARAYVTVDSAKANQHQQLAESIRPQTAEAFSLRAMTAGTPDEALVYLSRALELDPKHYASRKARAFAYLCLKSYQDMAEDVGALIVLRTHDYLGYALRAIVLREAGQYDAALKDHVRAITLCSLQGELPTLYDQRRETYMRSGNYQAALQDAKQVTAFNPNKPLARFNIFTSLLALGQYDAAQAEYERTIPNRLDTQAEYWRMVRRQMAERYVFEHLGQGLPLALPPEIVHRSPFCFMQQAAELYTLLHDRGRPLPMSSEVWLGDWSPDGQQIVYGQYNTFNWQAGTLAGIDSIRQGAGSRGLEIMDLATGKTRQLNRFGGYPVWSPDGRHIAFTNFEEEGPEVWVESAAGGQPRKLALGFRAHWSRDSKHVLFRAHTDGTICSVSIDQPAVEPVPVIDGLGHFFEDFALSPDESLIALESSDEIRVLTFPEAQEVARWAAPWPLESWTCRLQWHANGKEILLSSHNFHNESGICLFNIEQSEPMHVFNVTRPWCVPMMSPDGSRLIVSVDSVMNTLWLLDVDPTKSLNESLAPCLTRTEFLTGLMTQWDQRIEAESQNTESFAARAIIHLAKKDYERARQDLDHCGTIITDTNDAALYAIRRWAGKYLGCELLPEAEILALQSAQLAQRFPEAFEYLEDWEKHPFLQLALIYAAKGDRQEVITWRRRYTELKAPDGHLPGHLQYQENTGQYTLAGSGTDIGSDWDEFHFAFKKLQGNGSIVAKIEHIEDTHEWAKAGLMIRNGLEPDARNAAVFVTASGRAMFQYRQSDLEETVSTRLDPNSIALPHWIKLERLDNAFTAQHSSDGLRWEDIKVHTIAQGSLAEIKMDDEVYIGLAVTSHAGPKVTAEAEIANVRVFGTVTPAGPFTDSQDIGFSFDPASPERDEE